MSKRDYYEVLGVSKSASKDEIKKLIESCQKNIILILTKKPDQMKSLKKSKKHTKRCLMIKNGLITINLAILILTKASAAAVLAAATSAVLVSMIFSQVFSAVAQDEEIQTHRVKVPICNIR